MQVSLIKIFQIGGFGYIAYNIIQALRMEQLVKDSKIIR